MDNLEREVVTERVDLSQDAKSAVSVVLLCGVRVAVGSLSWRRRSAGQRGPHRRTTGELILSASIREPGADPHQRGELVFGRVSAGYRSG